MINFFNQNNSNTTKESCVDLELDVSYLLLLHRGPEQPVKQTEVLGHSLVRSLVRSHRSLVRLLRTTRFACSLTSLTPSLVGQ